MANVLYNVKTRKPESVPEAELSKALVDGTHAYPVGSVINVVDSSGQVGNVNSEDLQEAMSRGYMPETSRQAAVRQTVEEARKTPYTSAAKVALGQFADETLFSIPETIYDATADPLDVAKKEALKKEFAIANTLGGIGGFGASMFVGGPLFKAAGVAGRATERAILGGAEELAARGAESIGMRTAEEAAAKGASESIGMRGAEETAAKAGAAGTETRFGINPNAGVETAASGAPENVFEKQYFATRGTPAAELGGRTDELARTSNELTRTNELGQSIPRQLEGREAPLNLGPLEMEQRFGMKATAEVPEATEQAFNFSNYTKQAAQAEAEAKHFGTAVKQATEESVKANAEAITQRFIAAGVSPAEAEKIGYGLARKTLASAANQGVQAGVIAAPKAITEAMLGDPEAAAEHVFLNMVGGGLLGGAGSLAMSGLRGLMPRFSKLAENQAWKNLHLSSNTKAAKAADAVGGINAVGRTLLKENLIKNVGEDFESYATRIKDRQSEVGSNISQLYSKLDDANLDGAVKISDTYKLGAMFRDKVVAPLAAIPGNEGIINKVNQYISSFETIGEGRSLGFKELHQWRQGLDDLIWREGAIGITDPAKEQLNNVRKIITNELEEKGTEVSAKLGKNFREELHAENLLFRKLKVASDATATSAIREASNRSISPSDYLTGAAGGIIMGHPIAGIASAVGHKFIRNEGNALAANLFNLGAESEGKNLGILMTEQAMKKSAEKIDSIPAMIANAWKVTPENLSKVHLNAMSRFIGDKTPNVSISDQYNKVSQHLQGLVNDQQKSAGQIGEITKHFASGGAPNVAVSLTMKYQSALTALAAQMPKAMLNSNPYQSKEVQAAKGMISEGEMNAFARKIAVISDPFVVFQKLGAGTLSGVEVETMKQFYPALYQKGLEMIQKNPGQLNYNQRAKLDLYAGANVTGSQGMTGVIPQGKGKGKAFNIDKGIPKAAGKFNLHSNSAMTPVESLFHKKSK